MSAAQRATVVRASGGLAAFGWGAVVAVLGGLIGLGGAEFRLPVLLSVFRLLLLAVIANLVLSLVTVSFSLVFRAGLTGIDAVLVHGVAVLPLLAGSLVGAHLAQGSPPASTNAG